MKVRKLLEGIRKTFSCLPEQMPDCLKVTAQTEDGIIMAIEHIELPIAAVQFHPESILTGHHHGMLMLQNCISHFTALKRSAAGETRPSKKLKKGK